MTEGGEMNDDDQPRNPWSPEALEAAGGKWVRAQAQRRSEALTASGVRERHPSTQAKATALSAISEAKETLRRHPPFQAVPKVRDRGEQTG